MAPTDHDSLPSVIGFEAPVFPPLASFGDLSPDAEAKEPASAIGFSLGNNPPADPCLTAAAVAPTRIPSQGPPAPARGFVSTFTTTVAAPSVAEAEPTLAPRLDGNGYFAFGLDSSPKGGFDFSVPPRAQGCALNTTLAPRLDGNGYFAFGLDSSPKGGFDFSVPPRAQGCALNTTMEMSDDEDL
jgi:hypothetical protein